MTDADLPFPAGPQFLKKENEQVISIVCFMYTHTSSTFSDICLQSFFLFSGQVNQLASIG